jgi:hypothetical protein
MFRFIAIFGVLSVGLSSGLQTAPSSVVFAQEDNLRSFEVTFYAVKPVQCHDSDCDDDQMPGDNCSKFDMFGSANGRMTVLMSSACIPGGLAFRDDPGNTNWLSLDPSLVNRYSEIQAPTAVFNNVQANQLGPFTLTVAVPDNGHFTISTGGRERDLADDDDPNPLFDMVMSSNSKMQDYIRTKYIPSHPEVVDQQGNIDFDMAYYDVMTGAEFMSKIAHNPEAAAAEFGNEARGLLPDLSGLSSEEADKYLAELDIVQKVIQNPVEAVNRYAQEEIQAAFSQVGAQLPELSGLSSEEVGKYRSDLERVRDIIQNPEQAVTRLGQEEIQAAFSQVGAQLPELSGLSSEEVGKYRSYLENVRDIIQNPEQAVTRLGQEAVQAAFSQVAAQIPGPVGSFVSALDVNRLINNPGEYLKDTATDLAIEIAVAYGAQSIPVLGQAYAIGYALYKVFDLITAANPDDGIGIIHETCSAQNNFCVGTHKYQSKFNGIDSDSIGDYWMAINVKETTQTPILPLLQNEPAKLTNPHSGTLIQGRFGQQQHPNYELVVPRTDGGFNFFFRDNSADGLPWGGPFPVATDAGKIDSISLIQSTFGTGPGNLEAVAKMADGHLALFWREDAEPFSWFGPFDIPNSSGSAGNP